MSYSVLSKEEIIERWRTESNMSERDKLLEVMIQKNIFPEEAENFLEKEAGLYPDVDDPSFLKKLLFKQEFAEHRQSSIAEMIANGENPCDPNKEFELNPVQRFIGQFMSPKTPYNSALLFHGVGVGKTCSAITVAEAFLEMYPKKQVIIVAPRNIQPGFLRTIFNEQQLILGQTDEEPNEFKGCTGNTYLKLSGNEYNRNVNSIVKRVNELKAKRYHLVGYFAFYKYLYDLLDKNISKKLKGERRAQEEARLLAKKFSGRLIIIDEAHNLRDLKESDGDNLDAPYGEKELSEAKAARRLTPYLRKLLESAEGTKLLLLTATPMYNSYREIIPLLNFLLINDHKKPLDEGDIFELDGSFTPNGAKILGKTASAYVSFMRGENPLSFPIRLDPEGVPRVSSWPHLDPQGKTIEEDVDEDYNIRNQLVKLPFIPCEFDSFGLRDYRSAVAEILNKYGTTLAAIDGMVQAGNFIFPLPAKKAPLERIRDEGFNNTFAEDKIDTNRVYKLKPDIPTNWLYADQIGKYSPKTAFVLKRCQTAQGVCFVYSRFVISGALTIALALEANGYTLEGRENGYLTGVPMAPGGRQCALCSRKEEQHVAEEGPYLEVQERLNALEADEEKDYNAIGEAQNALEALKTSIPNHSFVPAKYVLLTGRDDLTPSNKLNIDRARADTNVYGEDVKVVIGSQVASEGIDLRFIRESFVFDSWFHLSKLEQVIGRSIRMCSHALLDPIDRNCTINLLLTVFPNQQDQETMDMFQYRQAFEKAKQVGTITRVLKQYALDCNLNHEAVMITQLDSIIMRDGQGVMRDGEEGNPPKVDINDTPFTSLCDFLDTCDYKCAVDVPIDLENTDESTYDFYSARWRESQIKNILRKLFTEQSFYQFDDLRELMSSFNIPRVALASILAGIIDNRGFRIRVRGVDGYITYKNKLYLFQPEAYRDTFVPLAIRATNFPVKQDSYDPMPIALQKLQAPREVVETKEAEEEQVVEEEGLEVRGDYKTFWKSMEAFVDTIRKGTVAAPKGKKHVLSAAVSTALLQRYSSNKKSYDRAYNSLGMVVRLYEDIKQKPSWRKALSDAVLKFIWDEFLNIEEQYRLYEEMKGNEGVDMPFVWKEHIVSNEGIIGFRRLNPLNGSIEFMCGEQKCTPIEVSLLEKDPDDEVKIMRANTNTTAPIYGTLNYKNGTFVFKTNIPVAPSANPSKIEKQEPGQECANVSNMTPHYKTLEDIGILAFAAIGSKLGLTLDQMFDAPAPRSFRNSVRACALCDIVLRFLDELIAGDKKWFYRPLATYYTGHKGRLRKTKK